MRHSIGLLITAAVAAVALAAPASADEADYLRKMQPKYVFLTNDQLMSIGHKACAVAATGAPASDSVVMISREFGVSVPGASDLVSTAVVELGC